MVDLLKIQGWVDGPSLRLIEGLLKVKTFIPLAKRLIKAKLRGEYVKYSRAIVKGYK